MDIQTLSPQHWARLRDVRIAALQDAPDAFGSTLVEAQQKSSADWQAELASLKTFVAVADTRDVGMVRGVGAHEDESAGYLISMWVAPEMRGRLVGDLLISAVVDWARASGFKQLLLDVADTNLAAIKLYKRMGFVPTGVVGSLPPPREHIKEHQRVLVLNTLSPPEVD
ncbi:MAG: GNAT family N-acetyltransferase [bacterium]